MKVLLGRLSTSWFIKKRMEKEERRHVQSDYECLNGQI